MVHRGTCALLRAIISVGLELKVMSLFSLASRRIEPEWMDQPGLDPESHARALRGLSRINSWSRSVTALWRAIAPCLMKAPDRTWRLLDLASGGGDVPIGLWKRAQRQGLTLVVQGSDVSPTAVREARQRAHQTQADVAFTLVDALADEIPEGFDIVTSSLFLHHLNDDEATALLRAMSRSATRLAVVDDLQRSLPGLALAVAGTRVLSRSPIVHADGPRSVAAAFTPHEALALARSAGWGAAEVRTHWPFRFTLVGSRE